MRVWHLDSTAATMYVTYVSLLPIPLLLLQALQSIILTHPPAAPCIGISPLPLEEAPPPPSQAPRGESGLFAQKTLLLFLRPTTTSPTPEKVGGLQQQQGQWSLNICLHLARHVQRFESGKLVSY